MIWLFDLIDAKLLRRIMNLPLKKVASPSQEHWLTPYECVFEDEAVRLLRFKKGKGCLLIIPPQAGHHSYIADYDSNQSLVEAAVQETAYSVYAVEWKGCTWSRRHENIDDLVDQLSRCVKAIRGKVHLIGLCQGGWLSAIYAALSPSSVRSLTIAGAPIDTHAGKSTLTKFVQMPMPMFYSLVAMGGGVMSGNLMLSGWKSSSPYTHFVERYQKDDDKTRKFYQWYDLTQDIAGGWYLWAILNLFKHNRLGKNDVHINDQHADLTNITCPVHIITGKRDDITPKEQSLALKDFVKGGVTEHEIDAGHIGVFMSSRGIRDVWRPMLKSL